MVSCSIYFPGFIGVEPGKGSERETMSVYPEPAHFTLTQPHEVHMLIPDQR
jgi:hypothetical protein